MEESSQAARISSQSETAPKIIPFLIGSGPQWKGAADKLSDLGIPAVCFVNSVQLVENASRIQALAKKGWQIECGFLTDAELDGQLPLWTIAMVKAELIESMSLFQELGLPIPHVLWLTGSDVSTSDGSCLPILLSKFETILSGSSRSTGSQNPVPILPGASLLQPLQDLPPVFAAALCAQDESFYSWIELICLRLGSGELSGVSELRDILA